jgi:hypothetical protein
MGPALPFMAVAAAFAATDDGLMPDKPPPVITDAAHPIANKMPPIDFTSVFDELSKDKLDIIRGLDGKLNLKFSNDDSRIDLTAPVQSRGVDSRLPVINPINERAAGVVALSQAMSRLSGAVEQMENTNPYLIQQNQELINSFRTASTQAIDRGFDFRQHAISQKLSKMGLGESSTAFGVQVSLAREKANAYSQRELQEAQLAQGLKQQSLANLHQRGDLLGKNAAIEQNKFNAESQAELANQELIQKQALAQKDIEFKNEEQRLGTEFANRKMAEQRRMQMAELGVNMFNNSNNQAINAQGVDNTGVAQQNNANLNQFALKPSNPWKDMAMDTIGNIAGAVTGGISGGKSSDPSVGTTGWNPGSTKLVGKQWS